MNVCARQTYDKGAAVRLFLDQTLGTQQLEGFTHRTATDTELLRDAGLHETIALTKPAGQDLLADPIRHVFGQKLACVQWAHSADSLPLATR